MQCIPILRPIIRDIHTSLTSRKLDDTENGTRRSIFDTKQDSAHMSSQNKGKNGTNVNDIALRVIPEKSLGTERVSPSRSPLETDKTLATAPEESHSDEISWPLATSARSDTWLDAEENERAGLSPRPQTRTRVTGLAR